MRYRSKKLELLRSLLAAMPARLVDTPADALVALANALQNWIACDFADERTVPLFSSAPLAGANFLIVKPIGDSCVSVTPLQAGKPFIVDRLRLGVLPDVRIALGVGGLNVPIRKCRRHRPGRIGAAASA
jgi:hypothetical protein